MESYEERVSECLHIWKNIDGEIIIECEWIEYTEQDILVKPHFKYKICFWRDSGSARVWWSEGRCNMIKILQILQKYSIIVLLSDAGLGTATAVWKSCLQHNLVLFSNLCLLI